MKKCLLIATVLAVLSLLVPPLGAQQDDFIVIVHADVPTLEASKKRISQLLLKEARRWDGGLSVQPVDLDSKSPTRDVFSKRIHGRSVTSIKNYWLRKIFSGKAQPPPEVGSDAAVIAFVRSHPGGIGYVSSSTRVEGKGVKILSLTQ